LGQLLGAARPGAHVAVAGIKYFPPCLAPFNAWVYLKNRGCLPFNAEPGVRMHTIVRSFAGLRVVLTLHLAYQAFTLAQIVNIESRYGYTYDIGGFPAPQPGDHINLIGSPSVTLSLGTGSYLITNAANQPGALHTAWSYNVATLSWAWVFVMADDATRRIVLVGDALVAGSSATAVASQAAVQNFSATFSLGQPTTLLFTLPDYYVPDNAGGISLRISPVPEPHSAALLLAGAGVLALRLRRTRGSRLTSSRRPDSSPRAACLKSPNCSPQPVPVTPLHSMPSSPRFTLS